MQIHSLEEFSFVILGEYHFDQDIFCRRIVLAVSVVLQTLQ